MLGVGAEQQRRARARLAQTANLAGDADTAAEALVGLKTDGGHGDFVQPPASGGQPLGGDHCLSSPVRAALVLHAAILRSPKLTPRQRQGLGPVQTIAASRTPPGR
jgi:hypothetical protein